MEFDFSQLEALVAVVEQRSFGKAARAISLSQSALSERIAQLEERVGVQLLDRGRRATTPTRVGQHLFQAAERLLQQREQLYRELEQLLGLQRGRLLLGASTIPGEFLLPQLLARFAAQHPQIQITLRIGDSLAIAQQVEQGTLELGIVGAKSVSAQLNYEPLWQDRLVLVVPARHPLAKRRKVSLAELSEEPFLMREQGSGTRRSIEDALPQANARALNVRVELGSTSAIKEGVVSGLGVSILSERAVRTERRLGLVHTLTVSELNAERDLLLVSNPRHARSPLLEQVIAFFRESGPR